MKILLLFVILFSIIWASCSSNDNQHSNNTIKPINKDSIYADSIKLVNDWYTIKKEYKNIDSNEVWNIFYKEHVLQNYEVSAYNTSKISISRLNLEDENLDELLITFDEFSIVMLQSKEGKWLQFDLPNQGNCYSTPDVIEKPFSGLQISYCFPCSDCSKYGSYVYRIDYGKIIPVFNLRSDYHEIVNYSDDLFSEGCETELSYDDKGIKTTFDIELIINEPEIPIHTVTIEIFYNWDKIKNQLVFSSVSLEGFEPFLKKWESQFEKYDEYDFTSNVYDIDIVTRAYWDFLGSELGESHKKVKNKTVRAEIEKMYNSDLKTILNEWGEKYSAWSKVL
jgi:hypothetical protein